MQGSVDIYGSLTVSDSAMNGPVRIKGTLISENTTFNESIVVGRGD